MDGLETDSTNGLESAAWGLFAGTGNPGYYMLYRELAGKNDGYKI